MNKYWIFLAIVAVASSAAGWGINHRAYGRHEAKMGPLAYRGELVGKDLGQFFAQNAQTKNPKVELVDGGTFDFGTMAPSVTGEHSFTIRNAGDGDLTLRLGSTTCKCTLGTLEKGVLKPGEETSIKLEWTTKTNEKTFSQSAQILTNDPSNYAIDLRVSGRVVGDIEMIPETLTFGDVANGEPINVTAKVYSFIDKPISDLKMEFSSDDLNKLAEVTFEPFTPSEADGSSSNARQAFNVKIHVKPGLRQGSVSQNAIFSFIDPRPNPDGSDATDSKSGSGKSENRSYITATFTGKIVGTISMISNPRLTGDDGGNYIYDFGEVRADGPLNAKTFVVLKGKNRDNTNLEIESVTPEGILTATVGEKIQRESTTLFPVQFTLIPGAEKIQRLGRNADDYGKIRLIAKSTPSDTKSSETGSEEKDDAEGANVRFIIGVKFSMEPI